MITYAQNKALIRDILTRTNHPGWNIYPGPDIPEPAEKTVVCSPYGGPGTALDGTIDQRSWQYRVIGAQNNYESAESVANAIDIAFLSHHSSKIGDLWVPQIQRAGGAPAVLNVDNADRTQFVCSYIFDVVLALPN